MAGQVIPDYHEITRVLTDRSMRQALEFSVLRRDDFSVYEKAIFLPALAQVIGLLSASGGMDLIGFGYRVTMNLTADFAGLDRPEKSPEEIEQLLKLVKNSSEFATLTHVTRDKEAVRAAPCPKACRFGPDLWLWHAHVPWARS
ncbi:MULTISPECIES: hypothetical protein [Mameliella]|uniref:hypothetical protein n=1 Tax=Mameliella TaxID=1434019 RepID=UPI000B52DCC2|nr:MULTISPECIES: hypothetical protein [Mameliella]MCR9274578.1 hypothetical protein [Paracoccaceae bacterium]OWV60155.1 hypothetical protein CDZ98_09960 [Mameliella alba]